MAAGKVHIELAELDVVVGVVAINALLVLLEDNLHRSSLLPVLASILLAIFTLPVLLLSLRFMTSLVWTMLSNAGLVKYEP